MSAPSRANKEAITFKSDYQQEVKDESVLLLQGNVEVHFRDFVIYANEVRLNDKKQEFFGVGNVRLTGTDRDIFADSIWYNYAHDDFDMRNAHGSLVVQGVTELVWFETERLYGNINKYKMRNGSVTTCTPTERREYHMEARSVTVIPGHRASIRNGYFFILGLPVFWFPYYSYSLSKTPWVIQVGKNSFDGTYVQTKYNYLAEQLVIGTIIAEYYSRSGWVVGADHSYVLPKQGAGSFGWRFKDGTYRDTTNSTMLHANTYNLSLSQALMFGPRFTGNLSITANSSDTASKVRSNDFNGTFSSNYNTATTRTTLNFNGSRNTSGGTSRTNASNWGLELLHSRDIVKGLSSSLRVDYKANKVTKDVPDDEELLTHMEFRQDRKGWSWSGVYDNHSDPDKNTYIADRTKQYTDKLPEIDITFQPNAFPGKYRNWLGFQLQQLTMVGAILSIGSQKSSVRGAYGNFDSRFSRTDNFGKKTGNNIQSNVEYWQAISSTHDAQYFYSLASTWNWVLGSKLTSQLGWTKTGVKGRIPEQGYDRATTPSNRLAYNLNYQDSRTTTIHMSTSYVLDHNYLTMVGNLFQIKRMQPLSFSLNYTPNTSTSVSLRTDYDLAQGERTDINGSISTTNNRSYKQTTNLNLRKYTLTQFNTTTDFILGPKWDFSLQTELATAARTRAIQKIAINRRLACTFVSFQFSALNDEWFITWGISAFPQAQLGYSTTQTAFGPDFFNQFSSFSTTGGGISSGGLNF